MALVPAVLTLNVSPCSFSVAVDSSCTKRGFPSCFLPRCERRRRTHETSSARSASTLVRPASCALGANPEGKPPERGILQAPVQTLLLLHVPARCFHSPPDRACHVLEPEVLQGDHPVAGDDLDRRVLCLVLALVVGLPVRLRYLLVEFLPLRRELRVRVALALQVCDLLPRDLQEPRHHEQGPIRRAAVSVIPRSRPPTSSEGSSRFTATFLKPTRPAKRCSQFR